MPHTRAMDSGLFELRMKAAEGIGRVFEYIISDDLLPSMLPFFGCIIERTPEGARLTGASRNHMNSEQYNRLSSRRSEALTRSCRCAVPSRWIARLRAFIKDERSL
jgi:hypothetical protein